MLNRKITLSEAVKFHGHLGPYLVLGILAGETALRRLKCKRYFGLDVKVSGADKKPKSCLIDGLQLSTGATYGKGNIKKIGRGTGIKMLFSHRGNSRVLDLELKAGLIRKLEGVKTHKHSESLAKGLFKTAPSEIFDLKLHHSSSESVEEK